MALARACCHDEATREITAEKRTESRFVIVDSFCSASGDAEDVRQRRCMSVALRMPDVKMSTVRRDVVIAMQRLATGAVKAVSRVSGRSEAERLDGAW
jgi:hypothetical protein